MKGEQLPLSVQLRGSASFESYHAGSNGATVEFLRGLASGQVESLGGALLYGPAGAGKTHLLQASARQAQGAAQRAAYLPLRDVGAHGPQALEDLDRLDLLCLDDVDAVAAQDDWALALIRLLDRLRLQRTRWLMSAAAAPDRLDALRPDLRTRLSAVPLLGLRALADADRLQLLRDDARRRGLELPEDAARWLLHHRPRDPASLLATLDQLDQASLRAKRRLTLAFVQQALQA